MPSIKEGILIKQGFKVKTWKKRWFKLTPSELLYFKAKNDYYPIGKIILRGCKIEGGGNTSRKNVMRIESKVSNRVYYLQGPTPREKSDWETAIRKQIESIEMQTPKPASGEDRRKLQRQSVYDMGGKTQRNSESNGILKDGGDISVSTAAQSNIVKYLQDGIATFPGQLLKNVGQPKPITLKVDRAELNILIRHAFYTDSVVATYNLKQDTLSATVDEKDPFLFKLSSQMRQRPFQLSSKLRDHFLSTLDAFIKDTNPDMHRDSVVIPPSPSVFEEEPLPQVATAETSFGKKPAPAKPRQKKAPQKFGESKNDFALTVFNASSGVDRKPKDPRFFIVPASSKFDTYVIIDRNQSKGEPGRIFGNLGDVLRGSIEEITDNQEELKRDVLESSSQTRAIFQEGSFQIKQITIPKAKGEALDLDPVDATDIDMAKKIAQLGKQEKARQEEEAKLFKPAPPRELLAFELNICYPRIAKLEQNLQFQNKLEDAITMARVLHNIKKVMESAESVVKPPPKNKITGIAGADQLTKLKQVIKITTSNIVSHMEEIKDFYSDLTDDENIELRNIILEVKEQIVPFFPLEEDEKVAPVVRIEEPKKEKEEQKKKEPEQKKPLFPEDNVVEALPPAPPLAPTNINAQEVVATVSLSDAIKNKASNLKDELAGARNSLSGVDGLEDIADVLNNEAPIVVTAGLVAIPPPPMPGMIKKWKYDGPIPSEPMRKFNWQKVLDYKVPEGSLFQPDQIDLDDVLDLDDLEKHFKKPTLETAKLATKKKAPVVTLLGVKRASNIEIGLNKLELEFKDVREGILQLDETILTLEDLELLLPILPNDEEIKIIKGYQGDIDELGSPEQFFLELLDIPHLRLRVESFIFAINFEEKISQLQQNVLTMTFACEDIKQSESLPKIFQLIWQVGNYLNYGSALGDARAFKLNSILKLGDTRDNANSSASLLHYLVNITRGNPEYDAFIEDVGICSVASKVSESIPTELMELKRGVKGIQVSSDHHQSELQNDFFYRKMKAFHEKASEEVDSVEQQIFDYKEEFHGLVELYGESKETYKPTEFFEIIGKFKDQWEEAEEDPNSIYMEEDNDEY